MLMHVPFGYITAWFLYAAESKCPQKERKESNNNDGDAEEALSPSSSS